MNRREWYPFGLQYCSAEESQDEQPICPNADLVCREPSTKVRADVIEALIGLIFIEFGYEQSIKVACELGVSFCSIKNVSTQPRMSDDLPITPSLVSFAQDFLGVTRLSNPQLIVEATTHQSCLHKPVPSYQRLEWVGDAVLCLAIREWLYRREEKLPVSKLVVLEATLECNQSLAFVGQTKGLVPYIDHRNASFPRRFQSYQFDLDFGQGLWSTDPPKVIPDVVEALIGAVHVDAGLHIGQQAALYVIAPLIQSLSNLLTAEGSRNLTEILHPKQHLYEMTGGMVRVRVYKHDRFDVHPRVWNFGNGGEYIGVVTGKGVVIAAVVDNSREKAVNLSCELAVQILKENPDIMPHLRGVNSIIIE